MKRSGVKERIVDNALRVLKDRRIIIANDRTRGEYRLPTKAFAVWIRAREAAAAAQERQSAPLLAAANPEPPENDRERR
jgi:hypothetical protein